MKPILDDVKQPFALFPLILASQSPRRRELLTEAGYDFTVVVPEENAEDAVQTGETPQEFVQRLAFQKAQSVAEKTERGIIIACDTVAVCGQEILGKPVDRNDAKRMLTLLSGQKHFVFSGLCVLEKTEKKTAEQSEPRCRTGWDVTELQMRCLLQEELESYLDGGAWQGKAGAFGYQDGNRWIRITQGSVSNVVGLPMELLKQLLTTMFPEGFRKDA